MGKAADQGNTSAQFHIGVLYFNGRGVKQDANKALEWIRKAATVGNVPAQLWVTGERGSAQAQFNLAMLFLSGQQGIAPDAQESLRWFQKAADQGYAPAQFQIGYILHHNGDFAEAAKWY